MVVPDCKAVGLHHTLQALYKHTSGLAAAPGGKPGQGGAPSAGDGAGLSGYITSRAHRDIYIGTQLEGTAGVARLYGIELEAVGLQFEPYLWRPCGVTWCHLAGVARLYPDVKLYPEHIWIYPGGGAGPKAGTRGSAPPAPGPARTLPARGGIQARALVRSTFQGRLRSAPPSETAEACGIAIGERMHGAPSAERRRLWRDSRHFRGACDPRKTPRVESAVLRFHGLGVSCLSSRRGACDPRRRPRRPRHVGS